MLFYATFNPLNTVLLFYTTLSQYRPVVLGLFYATLTCYNTVLVLFYATLNPQAPSELLNRPDACIIAQKLSGPNMIKSGLFDA